MTKIPVSDTAQLIFYEKSKFIFKRIICALLGHAPKFYSGCYKGPIGKFLFAKADMCACLRCHNTWLLNARKDNS